MQYRKSSGGAVALPMVADRLFDQPLLIHPRKLKSVLDVIIPRLGLDTPPEILGAAGDDFLSQAGQDEQLDAPGIAVLPVHGTLVQRGGYIGYSGMTSYDALQELFDDALEDPMVEAIVFDIDSGGGEVAGLFDFVDKIYNARSVKPIVAMVNEYAFSAAYALASACSRIYVPRTGGVGSVGVVCVHTDVSKRNEKEGFKFTPIFAGAHKVDFWPHEPLSEDVKERVQESINRTYDLFVSTVARNRGMSVEAVKATEAECFDAQPAVELGLADELASVDQVIEMLLTREGSDPLTSEGLPSEAQSGTPAGTDAKLNKGDAMFKRTKKDRRAGEPTDNENLEDTDETLNEEESPDLEDDEPATENEPDQEATEDEQDPEAEGENEEPEAEGEQPEDSAEGETEEEAEGDSEEEEAEDIDREEAAQIVEACAQYGNPASAVQYLREGSSLAQVRKDLKKQRNDVLRAQSKENSVSARQAAQRDTGESPVLRDMRSRVEAMKNKSNQKGALINA